MSPADQNSLPPIVADEAGLADRSEELGERSEEEAQIRFYRAMADIGIAYDEVLDHLARATAEIVFDFCAIHLLAVDGQRIELQALFHPSPAIRDYIHNLYASAAQHFDERLFAPVLKSRRPLFEPTFQSPCPVGHSTTQKIDALAIHSLIVVPLITSDARVIGTLSVGRQNTSAPYDETDLALLEWIANHAAMKVETARLYCDLRRTNAELDRAVRARDRFISVAAHELRAPLTVTSLILDQLEYDLEVHDFEPAVYDLIAPAIRRLDRQRQHLTELITDMLDISRLANGQLTLRREPADFCEVIADCTQELSELLGQAGCTVTLHLHGSYPGYWDRTRLRQIVTNLLTNVAKYAAPCPVTISVTGDETNITLAISDEGPGISEADQPRIFERFERVVTAEPPPGLGLGLWIVRRYIQAMQGTISVDSRPGQGATFRIDLPRAP